MRDTAAYLGWLAACPDVRGPKIGTTGYCIGGRMSLAAAGHYPARIAATASFHGANLANDAPDSPHLLAPQMKGVKIYVAGAVEDSSFPDDMKQRLDGALTAAGVEHRIETYAGLRHGWVPSDMPVHDAAGAERHFRALFELFGSTLA
jgi:carboxymethylenebutenolidase